MLFRSVCKGLHRALITWFDDFKELVSAYPTAGGIYTSTAFVVPKRYRASVTFVTAWSVIILSGFWYCTNILSVYAPRRMTIIGQLATPASVTFAL